jgi:hypothetical protein
MLEEVIWLVAEHKKRKTQNGNFSKKKIKAQPTFLINQGKTYQIPLQLFSL